MQHAQGYGRIALVVVAVAGAALASSCTGITRTSGSGYCLLNTQAACTETESYPDCQPCAALPAGTRRP